MAHALRLERAAAKRSVIGSTGVSEDEQRELARLRARIARLETGAWAERGLLLVVFYFLWDDIPESAKVVGTGIAALLVVLVVIERVRAGRH